MRAARALAVAALAFVTYIVFSGSVSEYDLVTGAVVSAVVGAIFANFTLTNPGKLASPKRWYWLLRYAARYFLIDETKCHVDVIRRILSPRLPVNPGIVKVPFYVSTHYAITAIANSITNTPGTVVVEVDERNKCFYVHWIDVASTEPGEARKSISEVFEAYSSKIFE